MKENVNHPEHYNQHGYECIDVMREVFGETTTNNFCLLNAFKYLWRCKYKGKESEDIKKAIWYLSAIVESEVDDGICTKL